jgi:glycosyltransferase involved in cell wall biosynthesis
MKICFVCSEYPPGPHGGIGTMTQVIGRALAAQGHEVRVVGIYGSAYPGRERVDDEGVQVWRIRASAGRLGWIADRLSLFKTISAWSRSGSIDIVEVPDFEGWAAGWRHLAVPVVARLHGTGTYFNAELGQPIDRSSYLLERASLRRVNFWASVCRYTADRTQELFRLKTQPKAILYNPVERPQTIRVNVANHVVFSGTLTAKKGIVSLLCAWPEVHRVCPEAELHVFGKDTRDAQGLSVRETLERNLQQGGTGGVVFHGHVTRERLFEAYQSARVAVFPSFVEAFAIAPLEAMACGCPTIYSRRGSGSEVLEDGVEGILVEPDAPEQIAKAVVGLFRDRETAERIGAAGQKRVRNCFSLPAILEQNLAFYGSCIREFAFSN